jgi:hypothetical protein
MSHIAANAVKETTTTTGTGNLTLAGAVSTFQAFSAECANNDTFFYRVAHQSANEWEIGYGTFVSATPAIARTTVIESSNADAAVDFSAGTKDVLIVSPNFTQNWGVLSVTPSTNQNDYAPTGFNKCASLWMNIGGTMKLTGLAGGYEGRRIIIRNESSDFMLWLEHLNSASSSANQFRLRNGMPLFLMPHDFAEFIYCSHSKWELVNQSAPGIMGLTFFSDCIGGTGTANLAHSGGGLTIFASGTGAAGAASTYLANTTERPLGIVQFTAGTTTTGRAGAGDNGTDQIIPTLGPALSVARLAVQTTVSGTETFQVLSGFVDSLAAGATTDGVAWNNRWNGSAAEWAQDRFAATVRTGTTTGSPTPDNNYIWLVVFVNEGWTRADFIYSTDSVSFTLASSPSTGFPSSTQRTSWCAAQIIKSAGTTARLVSLDLAGYRVDYVRG